MPSLAESLLFVGFLLGFSNAFDMGLSTKCVSIPTEFGLCYDTTYSEMRLPNLMGHTSMEGEVLPRAAEWESLVQTGCHADARTFICSVFAPVCMDTFIQPCRSMCVAVRDSCAPVLACRGQSWPESLDCDRFPRGEDMCLAPLSKDYIYMYKEIPQPVCQTCPAIEESVLTKSVLDAFCDNSFAVKVKLSKRMASSGFYQYETDGHIEFINQGHLLPYDTRNMISRWMLINERCSEEMVPSTRPVIYVIVGEIQFGKAVVNRIFHWQKKDFQLTQAIRKWRHHKC
ncbi:secreted frizzled-related protein 2-like [Spea bombifrons]|uniref:secreted frizzled-related protein 2-like n=1 Tax=Spea bombifrons TaxID=233779 RepID=UPI00234A31D6|nr:secreted frizzled-related protein 2-like [Spea bombifrons]